MVRKRIKETGEIFTRPHLVDEILDEMYEKDPDSFLDFNVPFLDPACGDGEFLRGVVRKFRKIYGKLTLSDWKKIVGILYGVDIMWDNVCDTVYYIIRSFSTTEEEPTLISSGFTNCNNSEDILKSPEEVNKAFIGVRAYKDSKGIIEIRRVKDSKHYVEYRSKKRDAWTKWTQVRKFVRANSLTEWDFENWCPK